MTTISPRAKLWLSAILTVLVTGAALTGLWHISEEIRLEDVLSSIHGVQAWRIMAAIMMVGLSYAALSMYDMIALETIGKKLAWSRALCGSISSYALSHNLGFAAITGTWGRYVCYRKDGLGLDDVARIALITGFSFWIGVGFSLGISLVVSPESVVHTGIDVNHLAGWKEQAGFVIIAVIIGYLGAVAKGYRKIGRGSWHVPLPSLSNASLQLLISVIEMTLATSIIFVMLPSAGADSFVPLLTAYVVAFSAVLITHAPGGAGVLESIIILMMPNLPKAEVLSALILFRLFYHILPLCVAGVVLFNHRKKNIQGSALRSLPA